MRIPHPSRCFQLGVLGILLSGCDPPSTKLKEIFDVKLLVVMPGDSSSGGASFGSGPVQTLTPQDARAMMDRSRCPAVDVVAPIIRVRTQVVNGNRNWVPAFIYGTTPGFLPIRNWENLAEGDSFDDADVDGQKNVCLLGQTVARELFQGESPVGKTIRIQNKPLKVVGVLSSKGANMMGFDQDDVVLAPWTTIRYKIAGSSASTANQSAAATSTDVTQKVNTLAEQYPNTTGPAGMYTQPTAIQQADNPLYSRFETVDQIYVRVRDEADIPAATKQITDLLRERHRLRPGQPDDFNIRDMTESARRLANLEKEWNRIRLVAFGTVGVAVIFVLGLGVFMVILLRRSTRIPSVLPPPERGENGQSGPGPA